MVIVFFEREDLEGIIWSAKEAEGATFDHFAAYGTMDFGAVAFRKGSAPAGGHARRPY
jgi:hypothetical protein